MQIVEHNCHMMINALLLCNNYIYIYNIYIYSYGNRAWGKGVIDKILSPPTSREKDRRPIHARQGSFPIMSNLDSPSNINENSSLISRNNNSSTKNSKSPIMKQVIYIYIYIYRAQMKNTTKSTNPDPKRT